MTKQGKDEQMKQEAKFLKIYQETGSQKEAYMAVGWNKTKASTFVKKWRQEQEARQSENNPVTVEESKPKTISVKAEEEPPIVQEDENATEQKKQVFSFRATIHDIAIWRAYATATGISLEKVANAALKEYMENHLLTGTEQVIFEALKARNQK